MFQPKLGLYALALEASAWAGVGLGVSNDRALLLYLVAHGGACALLSLIAVALLPPHLSRPRRPILLFMFSISYAIPVLGFAAVIGGVYLLLALPQIDRRDAFRVVELPQIDPQLRTGAGFRQAGMRSFLSNSRAPLTTRLSALVALQNVSGRIASPLLRNVLSDPSEDIRLLAYGMLDNKEKLISHSIRNELKRFNASAAGSAEQAATAKRLADLYWELVYQNLAQGDLRLHAVQQSLRYTTLSLEQTPADAGLHLRHGRLRQALGETGAAREAYLRALALGLPKTRIVPYLAELAYDLGDYASVRALMNDLGDWQSLPRLRPIIRYWSKT